MPIEVVGSRLPVGSSASRTCGPVDEGAGDRHALLLTARELVRKPLLLAGQAHEVEGLGDRGEDGVAGLADDLQGERDVLEDLLVGQEAEVLEDRADCAAQVRDLPPRDLGQVAAQGEDLPATSGAPHGGPGAGRSTSPSRRTRRGRRTRRARPPGDLVQRRAGPARVDLGDVLESDHDSSSASLDSGEVQLWPLPRLGSVVRDPGPTRRTGGGGTRSGPAGRGTDRPAQFCSAAFWEFCASGSPRR